MKEVFGKPVMHFIPLAEGVEAKSLLSLSDAELENVLLLCKEQEASKVYQVSPDVIKRQIGDEWLLVPTGALTQRFNGMVSLNEVGDFIWDQFQEPKSLEEVLEAAHEEFYDDAHMLDIETRKFVSEYHRMGFLREIN